MSETNQKMTGKELNPYEYFFASDPAAWLSVSRQHSSELYQRKEEEAFHNTYPFEQAYLHFVKTGDSEGLKRFLQNIPPIRPGVVASNMLRQAKNIFITAVTLVTRTRQYSTSPTIRTRSSAYPMLRRRSIWIGASYPEN